MKKIRFLLLTTLFLPCSVWAIDGYKNWKFGMSVTEAKQQYKCQWKKSSEKLLPLVNEIYKCNNFKFQGSTVRASLVFSPQNGLVRILIEIPENLSNEVFEALRNKYKIDKDKLPSEDTVRNPSPNSVIDFSFEDESVIFRVQTYEDMEYLYSVMYSIPHLQEEINQLIRKEREKKNQKLKDDL